MTDLSSYLTSESDKYLEEMFSAAVILPQEKCKITVHLEDDEGNTIHLATISRNFNKYIKSQFDTTDKDSSDILGNKSKIANTVFPLMSQLAAVAMPRIAGPEVASILFMAPDLRHTVTIYGLMVFLLNQYINQNKLKVVKKIDSLTDEEIQDYYVKQQRSEQQLAKALSYGKDEQD